MLSRRGAEAQGTFRENAAAPGEAPRALSPPVFFPLPAPCADTSISDLRVELNAPSGLKAVLHDRAGGNTRNLKATYGSAQTPALAALAGRDRKSRRGGQAVFSRGRSPESRGGGWRRLRGLVEVRLSVA